MAYELTKRVNDIVLVRPSYLDDITHHVNKLVSKSFGHLFRGNHTISKKLGSLELDPNIIRKAPLHIIARRIINPFPVIPIPYVFLVGGYVTAAGNFTKEDGSALNVLPEFEEKAEKYSKLYQDEIGEKVDMAIVDEVSYNVMPSYLLNE